MSVAVLAFMRIYEGPPRASVGRLTLHCYMRRSRVGPPIPPLVFTRLLSGEEILTQVIDSARSAVRLRN